ncbi:MAG: PAS domain-containing sensor histidine kinase [Ginsengibacter sp.]
MKNFTEAGNFATSHSKSHPDILKSERLKDAILNSLSAQIAVVDANGFIKTVNESWKNFAKENLIASGYPNDFAGINYLEICAKACGPFSAEAPKALKGIRAVLKGTMDSFSLEYPCHSPGKARWFFMKATPLPDLEGVVISHTDITERKAIEQIKDDFVSVASHELKTPITSLKGIVHILQLSFGNKMKGEVGKLLSTMDIQLNKLTKIIGDLLVVNAMPGKKLSLSTERFNFKNLVKETVQNVKNMSPLHFLSIKENESVYCKGDRFRLEQVITNLLTNAVKYSPQSNQVMISSMLKDDQILFSVQDFGIGIANENVERIFDKFYRAKTDFALGGIGLGLFISSEIVKAHGGLLWVESELGSGSIFYFSLPLDKSSE